MHTCETCSNWQRGNHTSRVDSGSIGECHEDGPKTDFKWPRTKATDSCARHSALAQFARRTPAPQGKAGRS